MQHKAAGAATKRGSWRAADRAPFQGDLRACPCHRQSGPAPQRTRRLIPAAETRSAVPAVDANGINVPRCITHGQGLAVRPVLGVPVVQLAAWRVAGGS
jgi:hypothetical protein